MHMWGTTPAALYMFEKDGVVYYYYHNQVHCVSHAAEHRQMHAHHTSCLQFGYCPAAESYQIPKEGCAQNWLDSLL